MKKLFLTSQATEVLDRVVEYIDRPLKELRAAFIPTAASLYNDAPWQDEDRKKLQDLGFAVIEVEIHGKSESELRELLKNIDIIFVAGGNTFYLLQEARKSGFDMIVTELVNNGVIYIGSSAGSLLAGPTIEDIVRFDDPKDAPELSSYTALGLVDFIPLVHIGYDKYRDAYIETFKEIYQKQSKYILLNNNQFIYVKGDEYKII